VDTHAAWVILLEEIFKTDSNQKCLDLCLSIFDQRIRVFALGCDQQNSFIKDLSNADLVRRNWKLVLSFSLDPGFDAIWDLSAEPLKIIGAEIA
jgi:hypothetical protein